MDALGIAYLTQEHFELQTRRASKPGIEPPTAWSVNDLLYQISRHFFVEPEFSPCAWKLNKERQGVQEVHVDNCEFTINAEQCTPTNRV